MVNNSIQNLEPITSRVRRDLYAVKRSGKGPACIREPFTDQHLEQHIQGQKSYGVYPIASGSSKTSIALLDLDAHKGETSWEDMVLSAQKLADELQNHGLNVIPWRSSGGNGIHLYIIWDSPQDAYSVRELLRSALNSIGFNNGTKGVAAGEIEIFPKQDYIAEGKVGNMFILPLADESAPLNKNNEWQLMSRSESSSINWESSIDIPLIERPKPELRPHSEEYSANYKKIREMLEYIDVEDYDTWIMVGMAIHYETNGSYEGLDLWNYCSQKSLSNYQGYEDLEGRWSGFTHNTNRPATIGSIKKLAIQNGWIENIIDDFEDLDFKERPHNIIKSLADLDELSYERCRKDVAEKLGCRAPILDKQVEAIRKDNVINECSTQKSMFTLVQPWPESVNGEEILDEIHNLIGRFIICDERTKIATSLWITFTWLIDHVQVAPIALITAPEKRCGKSQLLTLIGKMSYRPLMASNISSAAVYRVIESHKPTLLIDEADTFMDDYNNEIRGIINSGHTRDQAFVIRVAGEELEAVQFSTWGAKAIAGIGHRSETIEDRSINLSLRRKLPLESVEKLRHGDSKIFEVISRKLARFSEDHGANISTLRPVLPEGLGDRAQDNWEPLLCIADFVGGLWPEKARKAALEISKADQDSSSIATELLADIKTIFESNHTNKIHSVDLIELLCADEEKPWNSYKKDKPITFRHLSKLLKGFDVNSKSIKLNGEVKRGYDHKDFVDAFGRYLSDLPATKLQTLLDKEIEVAHEEEGSATNDANATTNRAEAIGCSTIEDDFEDLC